MYATYATDLAIVNGNLITLDPARRRPRRRWCGADGSR